MPAEALAEIDAELKAVKEDFDTGRKTLKSLTNGELSSQRIIVHGLIGIAEITSTLAQPRTEDIEEEIEKVEAQVSTSRSPENT
jgi:hypothetical protein